MSNQHFDDYIKTTFSGYSPDVPTHIWENIADLRKQKRRPFFWLLNRNILLLAGLLLTAGGAAWWFGSNHTSKFDPIAISKTNSSSSSESTVQSPVQSTGSDKSSVPGNRSVAQPGNTAASGKQDAIADYSIDHSTNRINPGSDKNISDNHIITSTTIARQHVPGNGIHSPLTSLPPVQTVSPADKDLRDQLHIRKRTTNLKTASGTGDENQTGDNENDILGDRPSATLPTGGTLLARLQHGVEKISARNKKGLPVFDQQIPHANPKCPRVEDPAGNKQYFEIYAGPDVAVRSISDTANTAYLQKRKESEKFSSAFSVGLRYTKVFNNGVSLRTGINYSQINEKFTYSKGGIIQYVYILDQASGDTIGSYTVSGSRYKTTYNRYRTVDIPLQFGYEMGNGRLHANVGAGVVINIYSWQKGDILDTSFAPVNITTGKSSSPYGFKTNTGFGFLASASIYYKLTERFHLMAEPYFRYNISPMSKENFTITQKYSTVGVRLGVRFDLK